MLCFHSSSLDDGLHPGNTIASLRGTGQMALRAGISGTVIDNLGLASPSSARHLLEYGSAGVTNGPFSV